MSSSCGLKLNP